MRAAPLLVLLLALAALPPASAEAPPADFVIDIDAAGTATVTAPGGLLSVGAAEPGRRYEWHLTIPDDYVIGEIRVHGAFDVLRAQQIVPLWQNRTGVRDDHFFTPVSHLDFANAHLTHHVGSGGEYVIRVGLPGPAERTLLLVRDVAAPTFQVGEPTALRPMSFMLETQTLEYAFADLQVRRVGATEWVQNPTTTLALVQTFPVQGLRAGADHEYRVRFWDWAGNDVWSDVFAVRTPVDDPVKPVVTPLEPAAGAQLATDFPLVRARVDAVDSPVRAGGVRVFVDLREVPEGFVLSDGNVTYRPASPLGAGLHRILVEVTNEAGGVGRASWSFTIEGGIPAAGALALGAAGAAAAVLRRRR